MKKQKAITLSLLAVLLLVAVLPLCAFAEEAEDTANVDIVYSEVLVDLKKDSSFDESSYIEIVDDYSLQVIQIAESVNDELFVYVYQPSGQSADLRASSINISKGYKTLNFINYTLTFINSNKTLYKYKVDDFQMDDTRIRYYDVTSIYRLWNDQLGDSVPENGNTVSEVPFNVSTIFKLGVENGEFVIETKSTDTIQVLSKFVGFVRYREGLKFFNYTNCDSHFVAFSTSIAIENLTSADVYYKTQLYTHKDYLGGSSDTFAEEITSAYSCVLDGLEVLYEPSGWGNTGPISRDRLQTVDEFIADENFEYVYTGALFNATTTSKITDEATNALRECEWVIRFAETPYTERYISGVAWSSTTQQYIVSDVSILRLEGVSDGKYFNLGVIDNKQTGSQDPINQTNTSIELTLSNMLTTLFTVMFGILAIVAFFVIVWGLLKYLLRR